MIDLLLAALDETGVGRSIRLELGPGPAPTPVAPYEGSIADWGLWRAAESPASAVLNVGLLNGLVGSLENSPKASEEKSK